MKSPEEKARNLCTELAGGDSDFSACREVAPFALVAVEFAREYAFCEDQKELDSIAQEIKKL